jgi:glutathione peroxidase
MRLLPLWIGALQLVLLVAPAQAQSTPAAAAAAKLSPTPAGAPAACPALLQHTLPRLQDEKPQPLCQYAGKVLLVVNTASYCGFTPQYEGLEALSARYAPQGLVVLGFPSNDFRQEDADQKKIADLCFNTFGVRFPMFTPVSVRGSGAHPLFAALTRATGQAPSWNFNKYLVGRDGQPIAHFGSATAPASATLVGAVEKALAASPRR